MSDRNASAFLQITTVVVLWLVLRGNVADVDPWVWWTGDAIIFCLCLPNVFQLTSLLLLAIGLDASREKQSICFYTGLTLLRIATGFDRVYRLVPGNPFAHGASGRQVLIGSFLHALEKEKEAFDHCTKFIQNSKVGKEASTSDINDCLQILAEIAIHDGNYKEAKQLADKSLRLIEGSDISDLSKGAALTGLCASYMKMGLVDESISAGLTAVSTFDSADPLQNHLQATAYNNLGLAYSYGGDFEEAHNCAKRSFNLKKAACKTENVSIAIAYVNLSESNLLLRRYEDALSEATEAIAILDRLGFKDSLVRSVADQNLGAALVGLGRLDEGKVALLKSLESKKKFMAAKDPEWFAMYVDLGLLYAALKETETAEKYFVDAMTGIKRELGEKHPRVAYFALEYASFLDANDRAQEAGDLRALAESIKALRSKVGSGT